MAEQCSQTDNHPLYLPPNSASFYTWIPALGFTQGRSKQTWFFFFFRAKCEKCVHLTFLILILTRGWTVQIYVPVRWRKLHSEPWLSVCGWYSLWDRQPSSIRRYSSLSKRQMPGRDGLMRLNISGIKCHIPLSVIFLLSLISCLAVMVSCTLEKYGISVGCVVEMGLPAGWYLTPTVVVRPEVTNWVPLI